MIPGINSASAFRLLHNTKRTMQNVSVLYESVCLNCSSMGLRQVDASKKNQTVLNSSVMFACGLVGNLLALVVLARSASSQRRTLFYRLVAGLVITDLTGTATTSPVVIAVYINDFKWIGGDAMCQYFGFMMEFAGATTVFIICAMSLERFLCIRHPYFYHTRLSPGHALPMLVVPWVAGLSLAVLPLLGVGRNVLQYPHTWCFFDSFSSRVRDKIYCYVFGGLGIVCVVVTIFFNAVVMYTLTMSGCKRNVLNKNTKLIRSASGRSRQAELEMLVLLTVLTLTFAICWAPLAVRVIINQTGNWPRDVSIDLLMVRLASINQILDPWIYILLKRDLLWRVVSLVKTLLCQDKSKLQNCDHELGVTKRDKDFCRAGADPSCLVTCRAYLCDSPDSINPDKHSPSLVRKTKLFGPTASSLHLEPTAL